MNKFLIMGASIFAMSFTQPVMASDGASVPPATAQNYTFDRVHTQILFFADHLGFSKSQGEFTEFDGEFNFDIDHPEKSNVDITINVSSIDMDDDAWNTHMKSKDFFNAEKFPEMTFKSTSIKVTGKKTAQIIGDLSILGITKPAILDVKYNKSDKHAFSGKYVSGFSATTSVKRSEYGMMYGLPMIGDDIEIRIEVEGIRSENLSLETNGSSQK